MTAAATRRQRDDALVLANAKRLERHRLRREMHTGDVDWREIIRNPPECVAHMLLTELLRMVPGMERRRIELLGDDAFRSGIHLLVRCERASTRTREWVIANAFVGGTSDRRARRRSRRRAAFGTGVLLP